MDRIRSADHPIDPTTPLADVRAVLTRLRGADPMARPLPQLAAEIEALAALLDDADAVLTRWVGAWDGQQGWRADGAASPVAWLAHHTALTEERSRRCTRQGRFTRTWAEVDEGLATGAFGTEHVAAMARAATRDRQAVFARDERTLVDAATALDPDRFARAAQRWAAYADDELDRVPASERSRSRRHLHLHDLDDGLTRLDGLLPRADAAVVRAALDRLDAPDPADTPDGPRTPGQRAADHLVELARRALARPDGRRDPDTTVLVHIDADVLEGPVDPIAAALRIDGTCGLADGSALDPETVRRFACDSWLTSVLHGTTGEVLEHGRRRRLFTPAQRRALVARDRGCVFPGCDRPAEWCDAHHLDPWGSSDPGVAPGGGRTDLANGGLLCTRHHTLVHEGRWQLRHEADGGWTAFDPTGRCRGATDRHGRRRPPTSVYRAPAAGRATRRPPPSRC